jgi:hypothetical protein
MSAEAPVAAPALAAILAVLEAERLAPVPRASHVVAVDVDDLALVAGYAADAAAAAASSRRPEPMSADAAVAWQRVDAAVRSRARTAEDGRGRARCVPVAAPALPLGAPAGRRRR